MVTGSLTGEVSACKGDASVPRVRWQEGPDQKAALWRSESGAPPPRRVELAGDATRAAVAFHQACEGTSLVYRGDYRNARQLLAAITRRLEERPPSSATGDLRAAFQAHRQHQSTVHQVLSRLLVVLDGSYELELRRAPVVSEACLEVWGPGDGSSAVSLRQLVGMIGAHEWRRSGVEVAALGGRVHPHYGVSARIRGEYVDLVADAPLRRAARAFDLGTGTGVLALVLARRGVAEVVATDSDPRAVACARENIARFRLEKRLRVEQRDLFPEGRADLIVFNPPWIPAQPRSPVERAIYDPDSRLLLRFLQELPEHLSPDGEAWLILSNLADLLGLRPPGLVAQTSAAANLTLRGQLSTPARHPRAQDREDPLYAARSREVTVLYRLGLRGSSTAGR